MKPEPAAAPGWLLPAVGGIGAAAVVMLAVTLAAPYTQLDLLAPTGTALDAAETARLRQALKEAHRMHEMAYIAIAFGAACIVYALWSSRRLAELRRRALGR